MIAPPSLVNVDSCEVINKIFFWCVREKEIFEIRAIIISHWVIIKKLMHEIKLNLLVPLLYVVIIIITNVTYYN